MTRFGLAVFLTFAALFYSKTTYIPLFCVSHIKIKDLRKCSENGEKLHCPNSDLEITIGCVTATKPVGTETRGMIVEHPTSVEVEQ